MTSEQLSRILQNAFEEDLPDITTNAIFDETQRGEARLIAKATGVFAGETVVREGFRHLDPDSDVTIQIHDGERLEPGASIANIEATVRALLTAERTVLNLIQRASGIATTTTRYVRAVEGTGVSILDTRKTAPGLRALDKYAVRVGGGTNHRMGLFDMFLVKDNHIDQAGGITSAMKLVRQSGVDRKVMIEVRSLDELDEALETRPDFILLDNMSVESMAQAVVRTRRFEEESGHHTELEASGGITLDTLREVASTGVDRISSGALTHTVVALDISLEIESWQRD